MSSPAPGWYIDPKNKKLLRWWNGDAWKEKTTTFPKQEEKEYQGKRIKLEPVGSYSEEEFLSSLPPPTPSPPAIGIINEVGLLTPEEEEGFSRILKYLKELSVFTQDLIDETISREIYPVQARSIVNNSIVEIKKDHQVTGLALILSKPAKENLLKLTKWPAHSFNEERITLNKAIMLHDKAERLKSGFTHGPIRRGKSSVQEISDCREFLAEFDDYYNGDGMKKFRDTVARVNGLSTRTTLQTLQDFKTIHPFLEYGEIQETIVRVEEITKNGVRAIGNLESEKDDLMIECEIIAQELRVKAVSKNLRDVSLETFAKLIKSYSGLLKKIPTDQLNTLNYKSVADILRDEETFLNEPSMSFETKKRILEAAKKLQTDEATRTFISFTYDELRPVEVEFITNLYRLNLSKKIPINKVDLRFKSILKYAIKNDAEDLFWISKNDETLVELKQTMGILDVLKEQVDLFLNGDFEKESIEWFKKNSVEVYKFMSELGFNTEDVEKSRGFLSEEIIKKIETYDLNLVGLKVSLRGYQEFGVKYALNQKRVIIGDEMGLGKTIEALAALTHLSNLRNTHFIVISPLAVMSNWERETRTHTDFHTFTLHGNNFDKNFLQWRRTGGIALVTFDGVKRLNELNSTPNITALVIDEAHYIKNPKIKRTKEILKLLNPVPYAMLLSGTPLENNLDEFKTLISYVQPELLIDATELEPIKFRAQISPAYLRRNQEDVLKELPEKIEVKDWLPMNEYDLEYYTRFTAQGAHHGMRQAASLSLEQASKVEKALEIIKEANDNGRKVLIFTYYRDVIASLESAITSKLPETARLTPISGSISSVARQSIIDEFSRANKAGVLLSQIVAGGTGLNIQAASVIIIMEPQVKPSIEDQAIARAHRMGQSERVQVHRLLSTDSWDEGLVEMLDEKRVIFNNFARPSDAAESTQAAKNIEVKENEMKGLIQKEQKRLGLQINPNLNNDYDNESVVKI